MTVRPDIKQRYEDWIAYIRRNTIGDVQHEMLCLAADWLDAEKERERLRLELLDQYRASQEASVNVVRACLAGAQLASEGGG